jgi:hypothetical protein
MKRNGTKTGPLLSRSREAHCKVWVGVNQVNCEIEERGHLSGWLRLCKLYLRKRGAVCLPRSTSRQEAQWQN